MKKVLLTIAALSGLTVAAEAQYARFGVKAGGLMTTASKDNTNVSNVANKFSPGLYAGGLVEFSFKSRADKFKLQVEADYSYMTIRHTFTSAGNESVDDKSRAHMVTIPVLAKYFFTPSFSLYAGPTANLNVSSNGKTIRSGVEYNASSNDDVNKFLIGAMAGVNYYIYKGFFVEARYHALLPEYYKANPIKPDYGTIHNFQLGVGYKF